MSELISLISIQFSAEIKGYNLPYLDELAFCECETLLLISLFLIMSFFYGSWAESCCI